VLAAEAGRVVYAAGGMRGYGRTVIVDHGEGLRTLYAHNSELLVGEGQHVTRGQPIAHVGRSGNATADHCHFEVLRGDRPIDPLLVLAPASTAAR
jgi:murein DD-endopeptidase MepM/ murein hydrolase activator NlpD